jgi:pyruvate,orthophosphate dikinase
MEAAKVILSSRGGVTSHAAVVARGMGALCVAGAESVSVDERTKTLSVTVGGKKMVLKEGDWCRTEHMFFGEAVCRTCR